MTIKPISGLPLYGAGSDGTIWSKKRKGPGRLRTEIAKLFLVGQPAISDVVNFKTWNRKAG